LHKEISGIGQKKFQTGKVISISFAHLVHDVYSSFLAPLLPLLIEKLGISYSMAGLLSIFQQFGSLMSPIIGIVADRAPVRYFIIATPFITSVIMSLIGVAPNYTVIAILLFVMGLSAVFFHVPAPALIRGVSGNRIGKGMSFYMIGGEIAAAIGPLIIIGAVSLWGLEGTYKLIPFSFAASIIIYLKLRKIDRVKRLDYLNMNGTGIKKTFVKLLPIFIILFGFSFFSQCMKSALTSFLPVYLTNIKAESLWFAGISLSILQIAGVFGTLFGGSISDRIGRKKMLLISSISAPLFMILFVYTSGISMIVLLLLSGFAMFISNPVLLAYVQEIDPDHSSFVNGIYITLSFGSGAMTVLLIGLMSDWIGMDLTFKIFAFLALLTIPFVVMLPDTKGNEL